MQNSLASYEQEKQANQATITNTILPAPKNRFDAARQERKDKKHLLPVAKTTSHPASPSLSTSATPRLGPAPTSAPASEDDVKLRAMKTATIHLLAMKPSTSDEIFRKTRIPKLNLDNVLQKVGKQGDGKWQLTDRAYKELDVWKFAYPNKEDRQAAIDNAVRAYDRMRVPKEDRLWQMLLPKAERDQGKVLSKLDLGSGQIKRGLTPQYQPSPMPHVDGVSDSRVPSAANTPRLGASTPRPGSSKGDVVKRLLSKDPQKARAVEEAKERKRKEREAAACDREGARPAKKQATKKAITNVKSAEFVHSSDEDSGEEGEIEVPRTSQPKSTPEIAKKASKPKVKAKPSSSSDSSDTAIKTVKAADKSTAKTGTTAKPVTKSASPAVKATKPPEASRAISQANASNGLSAPSPQLKARSPQKADSRPDVPSPLGAARPRVASDVSDRGAVGIQRAKSGGEETPRGLGITNGARKRQDTITSTESGSAEDKVKKARQTSSEQSQKPVGTPKPALANGVNHKDETGVKRKADDTMSQKGHDEPALKHRKTESSSSQSQKSHNSSVTTSHSTARTSPDGLLDSSSSDSAGSYLDLITYNQGVSIAEKFRDIYYPAYSKLYEEQAAVEAKGEKVSVEDRQRLWAMHRRLETMKREIASASQREQQEE